MVKISNDAVIDDKSMHEEEYLRFEWRLVQGVEQMHNYPFRWRLKANGAQGEMM